MHWNANGKCEWIHRSFERVYHDIGFLITFSMSIDWWEISPNENSSPSILHTFPVAPPVFISISFSLSPNTSTNIYLFCNRILLTILCMYLRGVCVCLWFFFQSNRINFCLLWLQLRTMDAIDQFTLNKKKEWQRIITAHKRIAMS